MARGVREADREALLALYWSTGGPRWRHQEGWAEGTHDVSTWYGVKVNGYGRVIKLDLCKNALEGTIPAALGFLASLEDLRLSSNGLVGPIPITLGYLVGLKYLDLGNNKLIGSIPHSFGKLTELCKADLSNNLLSGKIPREVGNMRSLMTFWLEQNHLEGPIPPEVANIELLNDLDLTGNAIEYGRLQGESLMRWRHQSLGQGSYAEASLERALSNILMKDQEIFSLRAEIERLKAEIESLQASSRPRGSNRGGSGNRVRHFLGAG